MNAILECKGLSKSYGRFQALDHVDLTLEPGKIIGLLGPNGSGKTTFIKLINQLLVPDEGTLLIDETRLVWSQKVLSPTFRRRPIWMKIKR